MTPEDRERTIKDAENLLRAEIVLNGPLYLDGERESAKTVRQSTSGPAATRTQEVPLFNDRPPAHGGITAASLKYPEESWTASTTLASLNANICTCMKCGLGSTRKNFVFGVGDPNADVVLIGEAPGADEDEKGEPFVGRAGQLLNKIIESIGFKREEVFICNILKCRPPNNREPAGEEIEQCEPYLWKQLEILHPRLILCLGRVAGQALLKTNASLGNLRGAWHAYRGIPTMVTYHPAALLRNPNWKRPTWEDVQAFRKRYDELKAIG